MKTVVLIYPTHERAEVKFREMLNFLGDEINRSSYMLIELGKTQYKFIHVGMIEKLTGIRINRLFIEQSHALTDEQLAFLRSRCERTKTRSSQ